MNQAYSPLISIVMPVYNGEMYLEESINSILSQTYYNFEFIVINDGSTDRSAEIIGHYAETDGRIIVLTNKKPLGRAGDSAKEQGIRISRGQYIAIMDADDIAKPQRLERQLAFMELHTDVFLCGSWAEYIDKNNKVFLEWHPDTEHEKIVRKLYLKNSIMHSTFFFRNEKRHKSFYQIKYNWHNDYYTQLKLIKENKRLANVPEILLTYRVSGMSTTQLNIKRKVLEYFKICKEVAQYGPTRPSFKHRVIVFAQYIAISYLPEKLVLRFHPIFKKTI